MTNLIEILKEQSAFGFTGKINLLLAHTGQFRGVVYQHEGDIVGAHYGHLFGKRALYKMIIEDVETTEHFKFIVEPELISLEYISMRLKLDEVKTIAQLMYQKYLQTKKLRPPLDLNLMIDPDIIVNDLDISPDEFDILTVLSEWSKVGDIYKYSKLMEFEITNALVGLRKKRAIRVYQSS